MNTQSKVLKWSLIVGIVIVINLFFNYTLSLVYKNPTFEAFCPNTSQIVKIIDNQESCVTAGGQWNSGVYNQYLKETNQPTAPQGYCDQQFTCRNDYDAAQKMYDRNVFITLVILGAFCVAIGNFLMGNMLISIALSLAGVLSFIVASMRYWSSADDLIKVIILAIALGILVWVAIKKFKNNIE
ncbi:hypothetical protein COX93_02025 [Candidatus Nomurabacteria bacterium CG_4_10_14_0_2_um_filter_30_12]|uniref:Uncharacterized protein n=3 Tax=Candidatus Nomuraibacteriota TaxID=1752729 RepID=A0A1J4V0N3_9BACT|nr:MAG: hypothetical protein AUJ22_01285 [Candidatus Nomurabacteria bacterium CG1_02_31_12]PIR69088.1 MAG: hypothetical protein COU48_00465 [Candidatus Nomurabacteria bacterium CG10_big_fil_rev_8_21_14_0_10_03_31_7]PIZ87116.1 MAG: hypothetical protein COX93_02025 [Candidatus Nomurabacteria bacterium CG_4_10_14_0_2_um_filter_30_12]